MAFDSFPVYPVLRTRGPEPIAATRRANPALRGMRILWELAFLLVVASLLYGLRSTVEAVGSSATPPPRTPFDFAVVEERFGKVRPFASREEIEELLGPPSRATDSWADDIYRWDGMMAHSYRHTGLPSNRIWEVWIDPVEEGRGVAILFAEGKVYYFAKKGF